MVFQESQSSTFWFPPAWGLRAYGQHVVTILPLGGGLSFYRTTERYAPDCPLYLQEELGVW